MKPLNVVHAYKIYKPDSEGGIPEVISILTAGVDSNISNSILVARQRGLSRAYTVDDVPIQAVGSFGNLFSTPIAPTYPLILSRLSRNADIIVHHAPFPLSDLAIARGIPEHVGLIVYWHAEVIGRHLLKRAISPFVEATLRRADRIIVCHDILVERSSLLRTYRGKVQVVPFGTDLNYWSTLDPQQATRAKEIKDRYPRLVIFVGRLVGYKGLDVLLDAVSRIDAQLVIIGEGPLDSELAGQARSLGISDRVFHMGRLSRDDIKSFLHAAKTLALPSVNIAEAFGLVQLEAMAAGCPVINTNLPTAVPHISRDRKEGLTVPVNDPRALAFALKTLLDNPDQAARFGTAARGRAFSEYSVDIFRTRIRKVYEDVVRERRRFS